MHHLTSLYLRKGCISCTAWNYSKVSSKTTIITTDKEHEHNLINHRWISEWTLFGRELCGAQLCIRNVLKFQTFVNERNKYERRWLLKHISRPTNRSFTLFIQQGDLLLSQPCQNPWPWTIMRSLACHTVNIHLSHWNYHKF